MLSSSFGFRFVGLLGQARTGLWACCWRCESVRHATKKAGGSSNNGRDSAGRRLGIKIFPNHFARAGAILIRQRGKKFLAGENVGMGRDHTIYSKVDGLVRYTRIPERKKTKKKRNVVHVVQSMQ